MIYLDVTDSCKSPMNTGIQRVVRGLFRGLTAAGAPVAPLLWEPRLESYCALSRREHGFLERPFAGASGRRARAEPGRAANSIPVLSRWWRQATHRRNRVDLVARLAASDVLLVPQIFQDNRIGWLAGLGARTSALRVGVFHDAIAWRRPDITPPANVRGVVDYMLACASFNLMTAPSREAADDLRACWQANALSAGRPPPIRVIGWPADDYFTATGQALDRQAFDRDGTRSYGRPPRILCIGTLEPRKNHLKLLAAAERLWQAGGPAFELVFVGRTTAHFGARVLAEVDRLRQAGRSVEWRRHVDEGALLAAYDQCAFTVFPSLMEGFGLPIIESLRRGRPCVCGANGALGEVAMGGGCFTVDQTDVGALAEAMRQLLTDEALYARLCAEARARQFETWRDYIAKLMPLLTPQATAR